MRPAVISQARPAVTGALLCAIGIAPVLLMVYTVVTTWLPLPFWDEWTTPGENLVSWCNGTLTFQELYSQHNESRKFFPRLLYLALAGMGGWDVRKEMAFLFVSVCVISALFYRLMRDTPAAMPWAALVAWIAATFLCFSFVQLENFLWGVQLEVFVPGLAVLVVASINLSGLSIARKSFWNAAFALLATYTAAHGMLLWVLGFPLLAREENGADRQTLLSYGGYLLCAATAVGFYFVGYERPTPHPEMLAGGSGVLKLGHYFLLWVGSYFKSTLVDPLTAGAIAFVILVVCLAGTAFLLRGAHRWRTFYPALLLTAYACLTAGLTAVGRVGFGLEQALAFRYRAYSLFFYLAIVALLFAIYCSRFQDARAAGRRLFLSGCALVGLAALVGWIACYVDASRQRELVAARNLTLLYALDWIEVIPDNPDLAFLFPKPAILRTTAGVLRDHGILRRGFLREEIVRETSQAPPVLETSSLGRLEKCVIDPNGYLAIAGWARAPAGKPPLSYVVLGALDGAGKFKLFAVTPLRRGSDDENNLRFARSFNPANLPSGNLTIAAWAIDAAGQDAYSLGEVTPISTAAR